MCRFILKRNLVSENIPRLKNSLLLRRYTYVNIVVTNLSGQIEMIGKKGSDRLLIAEYKITAAIQKYFATNRQKYLHPSRSDLWLATKSELTKPALSRIKLSQVAEVL